MVGLFGMWLVMKEGKRWLHDLKDQNVRVTLTSGKSEHPWPSHLTYHKIQSSSFPAGLKLVIQIPTQNLLECNAEFESEMQTTHAICLPGIQLSNKLWYLFY